MIDGDTGLEIPPVTESGAPVEEHTGSLAEFEQAYHGPGIAGPQTEDEIDEVELDPTPVAPVRNEQGQFVKPKHKSERFQATAKDHELINGFTKRIKEAEALHGKDITQQAGESNRVFELRRRAELAERRAQAPVTPAVAAIPRPVASPEAPRPQESAKTPAKPVVGSFENYEDFVEALADWKADRKREVWLADETAARERAHQTTLQQALKSSWDEKIAAAKAKYADFEAVALLSPTSIPQDSLVDRWILEHKSGADVLYHLQTHPTEVAPLLALPPFEQVEALTFLTQRLMTPTREAADATGAAPAKAQPSAPRPPTPVRTGPMRGETEPPDPEHSSLSDHERFFHKKR